MLENLFGKAGILCPECRAPSSDGMSVYALAISEVFFEINGNIISGILICQGCGREYPIIGGVPCVIRNVDGWLEQEIAASPTRLELPGRFSKLTPKTQNRTPEAERALVSAFAELHYGDFSGRDDSLMKENRDYWLSVKNLTETTQGPVLDLGCSVGRFSFDMARSSNAVVGLDLRLSLLIMAEKFRAKDRVTYERRLAGRRFETVETNFKSEENVLFIAGDALDPPFKMESFNLVAGLNILDNVHAPMTLLGQMNALLRPGGALLLGSPYEWREDITHPSQWLDTDDRDSAAMLNDILKGIVLPQTGFNYILETEIPQIGWTMRNHERYYSRFISHVVKARKPAN